MISTSKTRDTRLDVLRAAALLMIFIDHVPGQPLEQWTMRNFGFSDASELFVLISGIAVALAYGRKYDLSNLRALTGKAWRRSVTLFSAHLAGTFATLAIFASFAWFFVTPELMNEISIPKVMEDPARGLLALVTLGHQLGYNNILPMYMALMIAAPAVIYLERRSPVLLLLLSGALWFVAGTFRIGPPRMLEPGIWFFNPLSWQFIFVIGYVAMRQSMSGRRIGGNPTLLAAAIVFVVFAAAWIGLKLGVYSNLRFGLPYVLTASDKTFLTGWRLLHALSLAYIFISLPVLSRVTRLSYSHPLSVIGRHGLAIFVTGTVLSILAQAIMTVTVKTALVGLALIAAGVAVQVMTAYILERRDASRKQDLKSHLLQTPAPALPPA
jgi:hypothetical protein